MFLHALPDTDRPTVLVDCDAQQRRALMDLLQAGAAGRWHGSGLMASSSLWSLWLTRPALSAASTLRLPRLQKYSLHHKIDVTSASKHYTVCAAFGGGITGTAAAPERAWPADPRLPALGRRAVVARGSAPVATATWGDYQRWRITQARGWRLAAAALPRAALLPLPPCLPIAPPALATALVLCGAGGA